MLLSRCGVYILTLQTRLLPFSPLTHSPVGRGEQFLGLGRATPVAIALALLPGVNLTRGSNSVVPVAAGVWPWVARA